MFFTAEVPFSFSAQCHVTKCKIPLRMLFIALYFVNTIGVTVVTVWPRAAASRSASDLYNCFLRYR